MSMPKSRSIIAIDPLKIPSQEGCPQGGVGKQPQLAQLISGCLLDIQLCHDRKIHQIFSGEMVGGYPRFDLPRPLGTPPGRLPCIHKFG
jgi:hypothetical protein